MPRFFIPVENWNPERLTLEGAEAHHALGVLRLKEGAQVTVFNGEGEEALVEITSTGKQRMELGLIKKVKTELFPYQVTLAQAVPKGKTIEWILEKATELGATEIVPLLTERTVIQLDPRDAAKKREKWQGVVVEACKQCGQNWLPSVKLPQTLKAFLKANQPFDLMLIASLQPDAISFKKVLTDFNTTFKTERFQIKNMPRLLILIGPEGDFTMEEIALAQEHGCQPITLGPIILRTETAAIYCLSVLNYELL